MNATRSNRCSYTVLPEPMRPIDFRGIPGTKLVETTFAYQFQMPPKFGGGWLEIEKGFRSDGPTIPRFLMPVVTPFELSPEAWFIHDWLLKNRDELGLAREDCDDVFEAVLERQLADPDASRRAVKGVRAWAFVEASSERVIGSQSITGAVAGAFRAVAPVAAIALNPGARLPAILGAVQLVFGLIQKFRATRKQCLQVEEPIQALVPWSEGCVIADDQQSAFRADRKISPHEEWPTFEPRAADPLRFLPRSNA